MHRKRKNTILGIQDQARVWQSSEVDIEHTIVSYYKTLLKTSNPGDFDAVLEKLDCVVTDDMNPTL